MGAFDVFKEEGLAAAGGFHYAVGNLGDFQLAVDLGCYADEIMCGVQLLDKLAKVEVGHRCGFLWTSGVCWRVSASAVLVHGGWIRE